MLNRAKHHQSLNKQLKSYKKSKKQVEDKPTLIVCKRNGEYIVEMKVDSEDKNVNCTPLVYKIAAANNPEKVKARARLERYLIRKAVEEIWSDPYHPELCKTTCGKAYQQAIGLPYDYDGTEEEEEGSCSCTSGDYDLESQCSSLDVDWEIHFSPPRDAMVSRRSIEMDKLC